jgi:hypothetical protein
VWSVAAGPSVNGTLVIEINCEIVKKFFIEIISNDKNYSKFNICSHLRSSYKLQNHLEEISLSSRAFEQH